MTGRLVDISFSLNRKQRITLEVDSDFRNLWDKLNQEPLLDIEIKINPWSRLAKIIGHALNAEVLEQQKQTQKKLEEHIQVDDERNANLLRTQILRFNDELIDDKHHTREHFIEILAIIDAYEDYCRSHPDYKNNRCICAVANIKRVYNERLQKHDFS